jgi:WD40 repeat protein
MEQLELERIIGSTILHSGSVAVNPVTGEVAFGAGCVVVLYNLQLNKQTHFFLSPKPKTITCLHFSSNGKYLAVGESGYQPSVLIFDVNSKKQIQELKGHKYGVGFVQFSPNMKFLVSIGFSLDSFVHLWEWKSGQLLVSAKSSTKVLFNFRFKRF